MVIYHNKWYIGKQNITSVVLRKYFFVIVNEIKKEIDEIKIKTNGIKMTLFKWIVAVKNSSLDFIWWLQRVSVELISLDFQFVPTNGNV